MCPILEHRLVDLLRLVQIATRVGRDARKEYVMMAAFDHIDRIDLHIPQVLDRQLRRLGVIAERCTSIQPLSMEPDVPCTTFRNLMHGFETLHLRSIAVAD